MRDDTVSLRPSGAVLLSMTVAGAMLVGGGVAHQIGGARGATEVVDADIHPIAMQTLSVVPQDKETPRAAPDPVHERRLP